MSEKLSLKSEKDFENCTGNLRIKHINFDGLRQMWGGNLEEYDPEEDEPLAKFYIGKIGEYESCSYIYNDYLRCACIRVKFTNGYSVMVEAGDVEFTEENQTWEEFLPELKTENADLAYKDLNEEEMQFADKAILQMLHGNCGDVGEIKRMLDSAITLAIYRTHMYYNSRWDKSL